jgi:hypothetical protein
MATLLPRSTGPLAVAVAALLLPGAAAAEDPKPAAPADAKPAAAAEDPKPAPAAARPPPPAWEIAPATRRSGFTAGIALGFGLSSIVGYPNDAKKIGLQRYYTATGARPTPIGQTWIGGALTDWFTFGIGVIGSKLLTGDKANTNGFSFHVEAFPLFWMGGRLRDLGVTLDAGSGTSNVTSGPSDENKLVQSSAASLIGGGVFYEGFRFWRVATGPFLVGNYMWSDTVRRPGIFLGWRAALYTGP